MKVRAIKKYSDIILKQVMEKGAEFDVPDDRAQYLKGQGMVEILGDPEKAEQKEKKDAAK